MKYEVIKSNGQVSIGIVDMEWSDLQALLKGHGFIARKYKGDLEANIKFGQSQGFTEMDVSVTPHKVECYQLGIVEVDIDPETPLPKYTLKEGIIVNNEIDIAIDTDGDSLPKYTAQIDPTQPVPSSKPVLGFDGEYRWLSNFWCSKITLNHKKLGELVFSSVECAYQAAKCGKMEDIKQFTLMNSVRAKRAGKTVLIRADWDDMKLQVMESLLRRKFQIPDLRAKLLATGDAYLEETNYWHDNFWGRCSCNKCRSIEWQNNLGKLLMEIRAELKEVN